MLKAVSSITNAIGALNYTGTWNAATNTPTLASGAGTKGNYYQVSVAGSTALDGVSNWGVGDIAAFNGILWQRIEGGADLNGVNLSVSGNTTLGDATTNTVQINGYMGVGGAANTGQGVVVSSTALTGMSQYGVFSKPTGTSGATSNIGAFLAEPATSTATFTCGNVAGFYAINAVKGSNSTITNLHGVRIGDLTSGTNNYGVTSAVSSGANKWNIYASGTASNYFAGNVSIGGIATRATTVGAATLNIFNGTAPVGTLTNGISIYSSAGEAYVMDAAGNATLFSPHDADTNEWIFRSKHTPTGKVLKIDVERLLKFVNDHFGLDAVHEFIES